MADYNPEHDAQQIPSGYCQCGCGQLAPIATCSRPKDGIFEGQPLRFVNHHHSRRPIAERFWEKVAIKGPDDCWEWRHALDSRGYGSFGHTRRRLTTQAHRMAYILTYGPIEHGKYICHRCNNKRCCNPSHLYAGTALDNQWDKMAAGNQVNLIGSQHGRAKITEEDAILMRRLHAVGCSIRQLAYTFGIGQTTVGHILHHHTWTHVP